MSALSAQCYRPRPALSESRFCLAGKVLAGFAGEQGRVVLSTIAIEKGAEMRRGRTRFVARRVKSSEQIRIFHRKGHKAKPPIVHKYSDVMLDALP